MSEESEQEPRQRPLTPAEKQAAAGLRKTLATNPGVVRAAEQVSRKFRPAVLDALGKSIKTPDFSQIAQAAVGNAMPPEEVRTQLLGVASLADRQALIGKRMAAEADAIAQFNARIEAHRPPPNPMPGLLRDLVEVNQEQTKQIQALLEATAAAAADDKARADRAERGQTKAHRIAVASLAAAVLFGIITIIVTFAAS